MFKSYYVKTNKSFINALITELKTFGISHSSIINLQRERLNYIKFKCDSQEKIWNLMLYSRLIESLKIEIADDLKAKYLYILFYDTSLELKENLK
jgi:hypothetical protein